MALALYINGATAVVRPAQPPYFSLEELQKLVGGYIQMVPLRDGRAMILNEEGKISTPPLPVNRGATELMHAASDIAKDDLIVGNVLVCEPGELEG